MMPCRRMLLIALLAVLGVAPALGQEAPTNQVVQRLPLSGPLADAKAEISGLTWWEDQLLILPQLPHQFGDDRYGHLYALPRKAVLDVLNGRRQQPLVPRPIRFLDRGLWSRFDNFEGYEAIVVRGNRVFLTIESSSKNVMRSHVVAGRLSRDQSTLELDMDSLTDLPKQAAIDNMAYEALVPLRRRLLAIYEANGANVNPNPTAYQTGLLLHTLRPVSFPTLEYRITDATTPDAEGRFWAINFFYPGDRVALDPAPDSLAIKHHSSFSTPLPKETPVERLVELQYTGERVVRTDTPPLLLGAMKGRPARNWEGLARLPGRGFLIATDTYPRTILGFVPLHHGGQQ